MSSLDAAPSSSNNNTPSADPTESTHENTNPLLRPSNPLVTDLEQEVLDEYSRLLGNVNKVHSGPTCMCIDARQLTMG